jgi:putative heme transporter
MSERRTDDRSFLATARVSDPAGRAEGDLRVEARRDADEARPAGGRVGVRAAGEPARESGGDADRPYLRVGRYAWASLGIVGAFAVLLFAIGQVALLVIPLVLALFPAALLMPVAAFLKRLKVPAALAALLTILGSIGLLVGLFALLAPLVSNELPELVESVSEGVEELEAWLADDPLGVGLGFDGFGQLLEQGREQLGELGGGGGDLGELGGGIAGGAVTAATALFEGVTAFLLLLVALFFYLKDDGKLARGVIRTMPKGWQGHAAALGDRFWTTTGRYFRGQLLVAAADALFIGIGLLVLGVPLAIPLAVLVFFGGLFPIIGAVLSGAVAVLVALADAGPFTALLVAGLVLAVQQAESNVLEPLILAKVIRLHPLMVLVSITTGALLLGVLGAFLAVPVAASIARVVDYVRGEEDDETQEEMADDPEELAEA